MLKDKSIEDLGGDSNTQVEDILIYYHDFEFGSDVEYEPDVILKNKENNIIAKLKKNSTPKGKYNTFGKFILIVLQGIRHLLNGLPNIFLEAARHRTLGVSSPQGGVSEDDTSHKGTQTVGDSLSVMFASCPAHEGNSGDEDASNHVTPDIVIIDPLLAPDQCLLLTELLATEEAPLLPSEKSTVSPSEESTVLPSDKDVPPLRLILPKLEVVLQDAKDQKRLVSQMVCLVKYFGRHLYEICPNPTPTMFDEYCRMIVEDHPEVADRSYDVKIP